MQGRICLNWSFYKVKTNSFDSWKITLKILSIVFTKQTDKSDVTAAALYIQYAVVQKIISFYKLTIKFHQKLQRNVCKNDVMVATYLLYVGGNIYWTQASFLSLYKSRGLEETAHPVLVAHRRLWHRIRHHQHKATIRKLHRAVPSFMTIIIVLVI